MSIIKSHGNLGASSGFIFERVSATVEVDELITALGIRPDVPAWLQKR